MQLQSRYNLAPLAGYTNLPFRRIVRGIGGVGLGTTDLVTAAGLVAGSEKTWKMTETCAEDRPFAVQIFGADVETMTTAARMLVERGVDSLDINMGCPVARITKGGAGAGMMRRVDQTVDLVRSVVDAARVPVSVKMRLGWDDDQLSAPLFAREFERVGVVAVCIHGRTREQGFSGHVKLGGIRAVVEAVESIPVIGNGDVRSVADAARMLSETGCSGISIGRGALANPWIFRQLCEWEATGEFGPAGTFEDRLELLRRQFGYLEETHGFERALILFRKMGHWYLKGMRTPKRLRHRFQQARTRDEFEDALSCIREAGPTHGSRTGELPDLHVPVPSGPISKW